MESNTDYDWRRLPQLKDKYVSRVFKGMDTGFPMSDASDHFITDIEIFWFLRIDEDIAIDMFGFSSWKGFYWTLEALIRVSLELENKLANKY